MKNNSTKFDKLKILKIKKFNDTRGDFIKIYNKKNPLLNFTCIESYLSFSKKGSVRGLHGQSGKYSQEKLIYCVQGKALDIAVDLRKKSNTFGLVFKRIINSKNHNSILIPKGFAHGVLALENNTIIINFCSNIYNPKKEFGINIKSLNLKIPSMKLIISSKDKKLPNLKDVIKKIK
jgi:dTDP-4-dehydrorhamnose 3,5-epimerase